jgi:hypothetical protein
MRRFHNNVKRELYDKYTREINKLLDLACGKGGDLDKWVSNNIKSVVGYDINERSILEAQRRVNEYKYSINTKVDVNVRDLSRNVIDGNKDCDVVTSMFAFHYFFETEETTCKIDSISQAKSWSSLGAPVCWVRPIAKPWLITVHKWSWPIWPPPTRWAKPSWCRHPRAWSRMA